jgi:very-short-patch-repair endonuclease
VRGTNGSGENEMKRKYVERCRNLRKNQTDAERKLWSVLRDRQVCDVKFRRQFPLGRYILDFYSPEHKLGIEADGSRHYEDEGRRQDKRRAEELSSLGVQILRFSDRDILKNVDGVCKVIQEVLENKKLNPSP